jgi:hypothetical protein
MKEEGVDVRLREVSPSLPTCPKETLMRQSQLEGEVHAAILFKREKAMLANDKDLGVAVSRGSHFKEESKANSVPAQRLVVSSIVSRIVSDVGSYTHRIRVIGVTSAGL